MLTLKTSARDFVCPFTSTFTSCLSVNSLLLDRLILQAACERSEFLWPSGTS